MGWIDAFVFPLIDLYDYAQSDTANYMQDFNDTVLLLPFVLK